MKLKAKLKNPMTFLNLGFIGLGAVMGVAPLIAGAGISVEILSFTILGVAGGFLLFGKKKMWK